MNETDSSDNKCEVPDVQKTLVRAVLFSQWGIPLDDFGKFYKELEGKPFPYKSLGFSSLRACLESIPDVVRFEYSKDASRWILYAVADDKSFMSSFTAKKQLSNSSAGLPKSRGRNGRNRGKPTGRIGPTEDKEEDGPGSGLVRSSRGLFTIIIKYKEEDLVLEDIYKLIKDTAPVVEKKCHTRLRGNFLFFRYKEKKEAEAVIKKFNGYDFQGKKLLVKAAEEKKHDLDKIAGTNGFIPPPNSFGMPRTFQPIMMPPFPMVSPVYPPPMVSPPFAHQMLPMYPPPMMMVSPDGGPLGLEMSHWTQQRREGPPNRSDTRDGKVRSPLPSPTSSSSPKTSAGKPAETPPQSPLREEAETSNGLTKVEATPELETSHTTSQKKSSAKSSTQSSGKLPKTTPRKSPTTAPVSPPKSEAETSNGLAKVEATPESETSYTTQKKSSAKSSTQSSGKLSKTPPRKSPTTAPVSPPKSEAETSNGLAKVEAIPESETSYTTSQKKSSAKSSTQSSGKLSKTPPRKSPITAPVSPPKSEAETSDGLAKVEATPESETSYTTLQKKSSAKSSTQSSAETSNGPPTKVATTPESETSHRTSQKKSSAKSSKHSTPPLTAAPVSPHKSEGTETNHGLVKVASPPKPKEAPASAPKRSSNKPLRRPSSKPTRTHPKKSTAPTSPKESTAPTIQPDPVSPPKLDLPPPLLEDDSEEDEDPCPENGISLDIGSGPPPLVDESDSDDWSDGEGPDRDQYITPVAGFKPAVNGIAGQFTKVPSGRGRGLSQFQCR